MTERKTCLLCCKPLATKDELRDWSNAAGGKPKDPSLCYGGVWTPRQCIRAGAERQIIAELRAENERLSELVVFYQGEGDDEHPYETEWRELVAIPKKTTRQCNRIRELAGLIQQVCDPVLLRARNAELRAIVERLPVYADTGKPFVPCVDPCWVSWISSWGSGLDNMYKLVSRVGGTWGVSRHGVWYPCSTRGYSTEATAESAAKGKV